MVAAMKPGSVVIDLAVETGGNVEGIEYDQVTNRNGVILVGTANIPGRVPFHASQVYAANLVGLLEEYWDKKEKTFNGGDYLHPRQVLRELEKAMPPRVMVSTDIGNINSVANSYLRFEEPRSFFAPMSFGNCGYALPTIIGAKLAAPDRPAVAYAGDGAWAMSMVEILTAVRHDIPVTAVVFHNRQWGAEKKNQVDFYNRRFVAAELENESWSGMAKAMGAEAIVVDKLEDVGPALKKAVDMQMNERKTCVIEIMCTRELGDPFRRDALSKPVRFLEKYKDYV